MSRPLLEKVNPISEPEPHPLNLEDFQALACEHSEQMTAPLAYRALVELFINQRRSTEQHYNGFPDLKFLTHPPLLSTNGGWQGYRWEEVRDLDVASFKALVETVESKLQEAAKATKLRQTHREQVYYALGHNFMPSTLRFWHKVLEHYMPSEYKNYVDVDKSAK